MAIHGRVLQQLVDDHWSASGHCPVSSLYNAVHHHISKMSSSEFTSEIKK